MNIVIVITCFFMITFILLIHDAYLSIKKGYGFSVLALVFIILGTFSVLAAFLMLDKNTKFFEYCGKVLSFQFIKEEK